MRAGRAQVRLEREHERSNPLDTPGDTPMQGGRREARDEHPECPERDPLDARHRDRDRTERTHQHDVDGEGQALQRGQVVQQGSDVRELLRGAQASPERHAQPPVERREGALGPAGALHRVGGQVVRGEPLDQVLVVVQQAVAGLLQQQRGLEVLGRGDRGDASHLPQRAQPDDRRGSAPEDRAEPVAAGQQHVEEQRLLVPARLVVHDRVVVAERVGRLHEGHAIIGEIAGHGLQDVRRGHMVGVEHEQQVALQARQHGVDVARLRVRIVRARHVHRSEPFGERPHLGPASVVAQVDRGAAAHRERPDDRRLDDVDVFVVGGDHDVDREVERRKARCRWQPPRLDDHDDEARIADRLSGEQRPEQPGRDPGRGGDDTPCEVHGTQRDGQGRERSRRTVVALEPAAEPQRGAGDGGGDGGVGARHDGSAGDHRQRPSGRRARAALARLRRPPPWSRASETRSLSRRRSLDAKRRARVSAVCRFCAAPSPW